jgi:hypothetical protein
MSDPIPTQVNPIRPPLPAGFWSMPGGRSGLQGKPELVYDAINALQIPDGDKSALIAKIKSEIDGTEFNYVTVHATQTRQDSADSRDTILSMQITSTKKNV